MNNASNAIPGSRLESQEIAPVISEARRMYWSVQRELWENRSLYLAPLAVAVVFLFGFLISLIHLPHKVHDMAALDSAKQHEVITMPYEIAAILIMVTAFFVGVFYCLDTLYGERRDRSILFWKSLPVSDLTTVLSKLTIPLVILPLLSFAITIVTQIIMLLLSSAVLLGSGMSVSMIWAQSSFLQVSLLLLYHILTVHGLWYAPLYGWLLLVSAWARRAPFLWAFLPPVVIVAVERIAFNTSYFLAMLQHRLMGPESPNPAGGNMMDIMAALTPAQFFSRPGLWIGFAIAAAFVAAAVRLRRDREPI
jgi:ABC-2 type transport system permease protein